jgi:ParB family transcriptional regulator, chromosome partitioning protein
MSTPSRPRGLGRGLDALLPLSQSPPPLHHSARPLSETVPAGTPGASTPAAPPVASQTLFVCALEKIVPCRTQPRQNFDAAALEELTESIRAHGVLEPLVVRRLTGQDKFEIVAGERRWRAAQRAGLREVPVHVREVNEQTAFELALVENVQREDLNPIEFAEAIERLISEHSYTQDTLASLLNKDRSTLANALRLLRLPPRVRQMVVSGQLSEGHARALLGAPDDAKLEQLADKVVQRKLSVRQIEALVRALKAAKNGAGADGAKDGKSVGVKDLEMRLARRYGTRCEVRDRKGSGEIVIRYGDLDELDRILEQLLPG